MISQKWVDKILADENQGPDVVGGCMTVKRWTADVADHGDREVPIVVVAASDYDALSARLAEAERLLKQWLEGEVTFVAPFKATATFLQPSDNGSDREDAAHE